MSDVIRNYQQQQQQQQLKNKSDGSVKPPAAVPDPLSALASATPSRNSSSSSSSSEHYCEVCATQQPAGQFSSLACAHRYCRSCWELHFEYQILQGISNSEAELL